MTAAFCAAVVALVAVAPATWAPHPVVVLVVLAYALAARVQFPIGTAIFVPTQLFVVALFGLAPARLLVLRVRPSVHAWAPVVWSCKSVHGHIESAARRAAVRSRWSWLISGHPLRVRAGNSSAPVCPSVMCPGRSGDG